jgi:MFS family permease
VFAALQHRDFRLLWSGLLVSFTGSSMQSAALLWHVSLLVPAEKRAMALGLMGLVRVGPIVVFSLISGVAADAFNRRRLMLLTQSLMAVLAMMLAALTFAGLQSTWPIYALSACSAAVGAFDLPARHSLVPTLVPREHLPNAISLNTIMFQIASVAGPALGGLLIAFTHLQWVYLANAFSYGAVVVALLLMSPDRGRAEAGLTAGRGDMTVAAALEGLRFVFRAPLIRSTMLLDFFATFFSSATALLPIFAQDVLHVGARGYGWLFAAPAAGALIASAVMVRAVDRIERRGPVLIGAVLAYGLATVAFGLSTVFLLSFACLALTGAADTVSMVFRNVIRQLETPDRLRGRMTGVNMVFFNGGPQLGELEAGLVAAWRGPVFSVVSGGLGCIAATLWIASATPMLRSYSRTAAVANTEPALRAADETSEGRTTPAA